MSASPWNDMKCICMCMCVCVLVFLLAMFCCIGIFFFFCRFTVSPYIRHADVVVKFILLVIIKWNQIWGKYNFYDSLIYAFQANYRKYRVQNERKKTLKLIWTENTTKFEKSPLTQLQIMKARSFIKLINGQNMGINAT